MALQKARFWKGLETDHLIALLRIALGTVFVIGGLKLVSPTLFGIADHEALAKSFTDPATGWISPFFAQQITDTLGVPIGTFLYVQGWIEMLTGVVMILGVLTPMVAVMMGLMFWSFTVASPVVGEIRLSRDLALMGLCFAVAFAGGGRWSVDGKWRPLPSIAPARQDLVLLMIRLSLAYPLVASALFSGGVLSNHLNTTLPLLVVLLTGILLAGGVGPRWVALTVGAWMLYLLPAAFVAKGLFLGLDSIKREIGLFTAALAYFISGPDRWAWPKPTRLVCREVVDLILSYLEDSLDRADRKAFEAHIADCRDCWRFLTTYRHTVELGQTLREEDIPPEMQKRLERFLRSRHRDSTSLVKQGDRQR